MTATVKHFSAELAVLEKEYERLNIQIEQNRATKIAIQEALARKN
jgi:uncharacterized small protein (DUF1192 family)